MNNEFAVKTVLPSLAFQGQHDGAPAALFGVFMAQMIREMTSQCAKQVAA